MKQVFMQKNALRSAEVRTEDVPIPCCTDGTIVIANRHSLISAGTETTAVGSTKGDMIKKALGDADIRQAVVDMVVQDGVGKTKERVHFEMSKWTPLGYSGAGIAIEVGSQVKGIKPGDIVAYGGENHAEYVRAAKNLCVCVPEGVTTQEAAFVTVGSIAMQAVRRSEVQVGDTVVVIGLGLIGQLVTQLLNASGARVFGSDMLDSRLQLGKQLGLENAISASDDVIGAINRVTQGVGVDRVIVCAGSSPTILKQACIMLRERGRLVVVGGGSLDVPRSEFYMKELDLMISRSYGPGRYDRNYEEHGTDYPIGYVRWTENRNMQEFVRLIGTGRLDMKPLITHEFPVDQAGEGYGQLMTDPASSLGVLIEYEGSVTPRRVPISINSNQVRPSETERPNIAVIGCGAFAQQFHLPNIKAANKRVNFHTLAASTAQSSKEMGKRYGANNCTTDTGQLIENPEIDAVMVFTRDKTHAALCTAALLADKHVFCEKPLVTSLEECEILTNAATTSDRVCMTGFNRRFAPMMQRVKHVISPLCGPKMMHFRVNGGHLSPTSWVFDPKHSAGRIIGEACHFVDLFRWLSESEPVKVSAHLLGECQPTHQIQDFSAVIEFADGSIGNLVYTSVGSKPLGKERLEVFCDGTGAVVDDYKNLTIRGAAKVDEKVRRVDKGHNEEFEHFLAAVTGKVQPLITHVDGVQAAMVCLAILESARLGSAIELNTFVPSKSVVENV